MTWQQDATFFIFKRAISVQADAAVYRNTLHSSLIAAFIYSVIYGFYEYFIVYHYPEFLDLYGGNPVINWGMMYTALILTVAIAPRFGWYKTLITTLTYSAIYILTAIFLPTLNIAGIIIATPIFLIIAATIISCRFLVSIEHVVMGLFFMTVVEDLFFWISQWIDTGVYPFPAGNWWDSTIASYAALGGLGWAIPFWPYVPFYYIPGFAILALFYISAFIGSKPARIVACIFGPFFIAIIAGALGTVDTARIILIALPLISYAYFGFLYLLRNRLPGHEKKVVD